MYLSGHPVSEYSDLFRRKAVVSMGEIQKDAAEHGDRFRDGNRVRVLGAVQSVKQKLTKSSGTMAFVTLEDLFGSMELLVFPMCTAGAIPFCGKDRSYWQKAASA